MAIKFFNDGSAYRLTQKRAVAAWIAACISEQGYTPGDISFIFCSGEKHLEINRTYLEHDYRTDVITFDYSDLKNGIVSGDIFIDPETIRENARIYSVTEIEEMRRVLIHGVLHLCGFGDKTESQQKTMRKQENKYLSVFVK